MISAVEQKGLPRLGWIAVIDKPTLQVSVIHGQDVETTPRFIVEGIWNDDFRQGNFHTSDHFFGSGVRQDADSVWLVPSTALVDRLVLAEDEERYFAANSLVCLMAYLNARPDPANNYKQQSDAILAGVNDYDPTFPVIHDRIGEFRQLFYHPVEITQQGLFRRTRRVSGEFNTFEHYRNELNQSLRAIGQNAGDSARHKPLLAYTTLSRGYDSTATTVLARELGITKAFTSRRSSSGIPSWLSPDAAIDDGSVIAQKLGIEVGYLDYTPDQIQEDEPLFICPSPAEPELAFYHAYQEIRNNSRPSIMFTGYHGDKLWCRSPGEKYLDSAIIRGDTSGLNLSEARLESGFINAPIPFMYATQIASLNRLSNAPEMAPWSVGGSYDRPIPRRMGEEAGLARADFGTRKKAVISFYNQPKNRVLRKQFRAYLNHQTGLSRTRIELQNITDKIVFFLKKLAAKIAGVAGIPGKPVLSRSTLDLPYKMHIWALERQIKIQRNKLGRL
ncbi:MAG: hypothetical protein HLX50_11770 [Alteromonadaceae bacterium]|nr:hypothetical protein [Alteromonadaceae bacterium]